MIRDPSRRPGRTSPRPGARPWLAALLLVSPLFPAASLRAMEIPLDSFGKTSKVAYVNMHKIFEAFPETEKARVELNELIDQKKAEITAKKEEIARLKAEVDFLRRQMSAVVPSTQPRVAPPEPEAQPQPAEAAPSTGPATATSLTLPPGSPLGFLFIPPENSTKPAPGESDLSQSSAAVPGRVAISTAAPSILPGIPSPAPQLSDKEAELSQKQSDLETFIGAAEEEVKRLEEGKTMTLMARIYKALGEIADKDGYTVIVDRDNILYGSNADDITQDVVWRLSAVRLKGTQRP